MREIAAGVGLALTITGGQSVAQGTLVQLAGARGHLVEQQPAQVERREAGVARVADLGLDGERLLAALAGLGVAADVAQSRPRSFRSIASRRRSPIMLLASPRW